jgi:hypothetical protein
MADDLRVTGPAPEVAALRNRAAGGGVIPWVYPDLDHWEEDQVHALVQRKRGTEAVLLFGREVCSVGPGRGASSYHYVRR